MKTYCFQIVPEDLTAREKLAYQNYFNHKSQFKDITEEHYNEIQRKMWSGDQKAVAESSVWLDLEKEDSLRAAMYDSFNLWDESDLLVAVLNAQHGVLEKFMESEITEGKILVFKEKWEALKKNPNWGDSEADSMENVLAWLKSNIGKKVRIYC